jgi:hypothetical protein
MVFSDGKGIYEYMREKSQRWMLILMKTFDHLFKKVFVPKNLMIFVSQIHFL